jgi:hypothetical protein
LSVVRVFHPPNRLAKALVETGGRTAEEAVASAEARVGELASSLRRSIDVQVEALLALHRAGAAALPDHTGELADAAMGLAEIAGAAGRAELGEVARGVLAMLEHPGGAARADALDLHLSAVALLRAGAGRGETETVLERLQDLRAALGVTD